MELIGILGVSASLAFNFLFVYLWYRDHRPPVRKLRWKKALQGMMMLKHQVQESKFHPDLVVGIHTIGIGGGAIVGDVLACHLQLPLHVICVDLAGKNGHPLIRGSARRMFTGKKVLVVDDVCVSGRTLKAVYDFLSKACEEVRIAVIVKPIGKNPLPVKIHYSAYETPYYVLDREWRIQPVILDQP